MNNEQLALLFNQLRALPQECEWVEFKTNNSNPEKLGQNISALSNAAFLSEKEHGYIIYGIEDITHKPVGTTFNPLTAKVKNQEIVNYIITQLEPQIGIEYFPFSISNIAIVIIKIERATHKPVRYKGEAYIRIGSYTKKLKDHTDKEKLLWNRFNNIVFETGFATGPLKSTDVLKLLEYSKIFKLLNIPLPETRNTILGRLVEEKLIVEKLKSYYITNLGAILFAYNLNDFKNLGRKSIRVIKYSGKDKLETIEEIEHTSGYAIAFEQIVGSISNFIPRVEKIKGPYRESIHAFPPLAIRELIANAIIHQDFSIDGTSVMVEIFSNRIEITNAGKPLIDVMRFIDHTPISRNDSLGRLMRRMKICEERGSGIDKVVAVIEIAQLPAPEFISASNYTRVKLYEPKSLRQLSKIDKVRAAYQHCVMKYLTGDNMTNQSIRLRFGINDKNYPQASRIIKQAIEDGLIMEYENTKTYIPFWA